MEGDVHLFIIIYSKDENLLGASAAVNCVIIKWCKYLYCMIAQFRVPFCGIFFVDKLYF
jgi:hypothetical protein